MVGSMYAAISGLRAHQQKMNVIGNNIANVNTYGYKSQRTTFKESMYSSLRASTGGTATMGGTNASQIGYGCSVGTIDMNMKTGTYAITDRTLDVMIDGDGFLITGNIDAGGYDIVGGDSIDGLQLSRLGNLDFDNNGYLVDGNGNVIYGFAKDGQGDYDDTYTLVPLKKPADPNEPDEVMALTNISVSDKGEITGSYGDQIITIGCIALAYVDNPNGLTHLGGPYYQAGGNAGGVRAGTVGNVIGAGDDTGIVNFNSSFVPGALEMSNVDISNEFADLITTQRGFQANTKIITVTDEMLSDLVSMKR